MNVKRSFGVRMGEISSLVYLIFPIFGLFDSERVSNKLIYYRFIHFYGFIFNARSASH